MIKNERGYTIMELLVVIVIIGVLAAIGVPAYNNMTTRARKTACDANKRTIATAVGMYYADHEDYPADGAATSTLADPNGNLYIENVAAFVCPADGSSYTIVNGANVSVHCGHADHADLVIK